MCDTYAWYIHLFWGSMAYKLHLRRIIYCGHILWFFIVNRKSSITLKLSWTSSKLLRTSSKLNGTRSEYRWIWVLLLCFRARFFKLCDFSMTEFNGNKPTLIFFHDSLTKPSDFWRKWIWFGSRCNNNYNLNGIVPAVFFCDELNFECAYCYILTQLIPLLDQLSQREDTYIIGDLLYWTFLNLIVF